ncbi:MAG: ribosome maturation factor RimM [Rickettsiales bacterium]|nr:ribosome maturation factor RimM [Rickettsiales bacterium]
MQHHDTLVAVGVITSAHGVRGEVKIKSFTESPEDLTAYGTLTDADGKALQIQIKGHSKGQLIARLKDINDRNQAEALKGKELFIHRDQLPESDDSDGFYITDMIGLKVSLGDGTPFGIIKAVHNFGAGDVIEIKRNDTKKTELLSFTDACFPVVDIKKSLIVCNPPEYVKGTPEKQEEDDV